MHSRSVRVFCTMYSNIMHMHLYSLYAHFSTGVIAFIDIFYIGI